MQELPVYVDQAGVHWQTINGDCSQCERAGQRPAGKWALKMGEKPEPANCYIVIMKMVFMNENKHKKAGLCVEKQNYN